LSTTVWSVAALFTHWGLRVLEHGRKASRYILSTNGGYRSLSTTLWPGAVLLASMGAKGVTFPDTVSPIAAISLAMVEARGRTVWPYSHS